MTITTVSEYGGVPGTGPRSAIPAVPSLVTVEEPEVPARPLGRSRLLCVGSLVVALAPIVVTAARAISSGWVPTFDAGYYTVRSLDVLTAHHPMFGAWTSASPQVGTTLHTLGPLQLDLLAPFTRVDPYRGTAVGVAAIAAAAVVAVWYSARRTLGPIAAVGAMLATVALEATIGSQAFRDPRPQLYLLLPFWALLWLIWALAAGEGWALWAAVLAASLIVQTHFTLLYQTFVLLAFGVGGFVVAIRRRWRESRATRSVLIALGVGAVCWAQPVWDQLVGDRNLGAVLAERGSAEGIGLAHGGRVIAGTVLVPWFWLPGTMGSFHLPGDEAGGAAAVAAVVSWFVMLAGAAAVAIWRRHHRLALLALTGAVALGGALVAASSIPPTALGLAPQSYFWMWPTGVFLSVAAGAGIIAAVPVGWLEARPVLLCATPLLIALAAIAMRPPTEWTTVDSETTAGSRVIRPVLDRLAASLDRLGVEGPLLVDYHRASWGNYIGYTVLAELQEAGIDYTFLPGDTNVARFGDGRCERGDATGRLIITDGGGDPVRRDGELVLAQVDGLGAEGRAELHQLERRFGALIHDRTVAISLEELEFLAGGEIPGLRGVLASPHSSATELGRTLNNWRDRGVVLVPGDLDDEFERWVDLEIRSTLESITILLAPVQEDVPTTDEVLARSCIG